jgi:cytochrome c-type biogenesis protein CcmF
MEVDNNKRMIFADVAVTRDGEYKGKLNPAKFIYKKMPDSPTTEVAMMHSVRDDLYLVVGTVNPETKVASLQIHINPLVGWIWFGCIILIFGSFVCMWPELEPQESRVWQVARGAGAVATSIAVGVFLALLPVPAFAQQTATQHAGSIEIQDGKERAVFQQLRCMCGTCPRELLSTCACSTADQTRERIRGQLAKGVTAQKIIDDYVAEHTTAALAMPPNTGGMRAIYMVPIAGVGLAGIGLALLFRKWRRAPTPAKSDGKKERDDYDDRIDQELRDLDD